MPNFFLIILYMNLLHNKKMKYIINLKLRNDLLMFYIKIESKMSWETNGWTNSVEYYFQEEYYCANWVWYITLLIFILCHMWYNNCIINLHLIILNPLHSIWPKSFFINKQYVYLLIKNVSSLITLLYVTNIHFLSFSYKTELE